MDFTLPIAITPVEGQGPQFFNSQPTSSTGLVKHLLDHFIPHSRNNYHPHIFSHRMTGLLSAFLVALKIFTVAAVAWGPVVPAFSEAITSANIISLTNQSRQAQSLGLLTANTMLAAAAQSKANDMLAKGYFSHTSPDGRSPWDFVSTAGYNYITAGENLAVNFTEAENVEDAWMNSPGHRANILNGGFKEIGIGIAQGSYQGHDAIFVVQMFGTQANQKVVLDEKPTAVAEKTVPAPVVKETLIPKSNNIETKAVVSSVPEPVSADLAPESSLPVNEIVPLSLADAKASLNGNILTVSVVAESAAKVVAVYGSQGLMLSPKENNVWQGELDISDLAKSSASVVVRAYSLSGEVKSVSAGDFSSSLSTNFALHPEVKSARISLGGLTFDPKSLEKNAYLIFIVGMLASLILAIGIKRHIQHLSLVANGSLVILLAVLLWVR